MRLLSFSAAAAFVAGMVTLTVGTWQAAVSQQLSELTGYGALMSSAEGPFTSADVPLMSIDTSYHAAAEPVSSGAALPMIIGSLLILLALMVHALLLLRRERTVPVHEARSPRAEQPRRVYWMSLRVW